MTMFQKYTVRYVIWSFDCSLNIVVRQYHEISRTSRAHDPRANAICIPHSLRPSGTTRKLHIHLPAAEVTCTISFQIYHENIEKALAELSLDARGVIASQNGEVNTALLRTWLRKLRQICTHPQVGQLQKSGDRLYRPGVLKTMKQVLEGMKDQNWRNVIDDRCSKARFDLNFP